MFTADNLHCTLASLGIQAPGDIFEQLAIAYSAPGRHYHNQTHIAHCLRLARQHRTLMIRPDEVELALWFHDAIYESRCQDNEEQSAHWAQDYLNSVHADPDTIDRIVAMILATKNHFASRVDTAVLLDIDLAILGTERLQFEAYDQAIRREYHWVLEPDYLIARQNCLNAYLQRAAIYQTPDFRAHYESQARHNLTSKVLELQTAVEDIA